MRKKTQRPKPSLKALTLTETLITIVILSVGIIGVTKAFNTGLTASSGSENVNLALDIARKTMEQIKNTAFANLSDSGPAPDTDFSRFNVTVDVAEGQDPMQVDVVVAWPAKGGTSNVTLSTLVADY